MNRSTAALALGLALLCPAGLTACSRRKPEEAPVVEVTRPAPAKPAEGQPPAAQQQPAQRAESKRQPGNSVLNAPTDYLRTVTITVPDRARRTINTAYIQREVEEYRADQGHYPESLKALEDWRGEPLQAPGKGLEFRYDPKTGKLDVVDSEE